METNVSKRQTPRRTITSSLEAGSNSLPDMHDMKNVFDRPWHVRLDPNPSIFLTVTPEVLMLEVVILQLQELSVISGMFPSPPRHI